MDEHPQDMTVYDFWNSNRQQYRIMIRLGALSCLLERDLSLYERYEQEYERTQSRMQSASITAAEFKISERSVFRVVDKYSREVPMM